MPRRGRKSVVPRSTKRARGRTRGRMWRTSRRNRIPRPLALKPHAFVERLTADTITVNSEASASGLFKTFNLDQVAQASNYKALFEYYTINKIVVEFRYKSVSQVATGYSASSGTLVIPNEVNPVLYFKIDHNDITADTLATMKESSKTKEHQFTNDKPNFSIQLKPAVQSEAYKSSIATTYIPKWGQQLSTADGTVPHYGLKAYCVAFTDSTVNPGVLDVQYKMYFTMRNNE